MIKTLQNRSQSVTSAATIISAAYLLSRILGLLRDRLLIAHFGKGPILDAYNAAFSVPDLLFTLLVSGAFAVAFIPVFTAERQKDDQSQAWEVSSSLLNLLVLSTVALGLLGMLFASPLVHLTAAGFHGSEHDLTVSLTRIMLITPVLFSISSVFGSIQQAMNRFLVYALASVMYNVGIIIGILLLAGHWGIYGVAWGVVLGTILQALLQALGLAGLGFKYRPRLNLRLKGVRKVLLLMLPRSFDQGIDQVNYVVEKAIGSTLAPGNVTAYALANNLKNVPLSLIGQAIATASFPRLTAQVAEGKREQLAANVAATMRLVLFLALPSAIMAVMARGYLVRLLYGFGDTATANTLGWFAGTIVFVSLFYIVTRIFYAYQDTKTPLKISIIAFVLNIILAFTLSRRFGVVGLAMAASLVDAFEAITLVLILRHRGIPLGARVFLNGAWRMVVAGAIMTAALFAAIHYLVPLYASYHGFATLLPNFVAILVIGAVGYLLPCYLLQLGELKLAYTKVRALIARPLGLN